MRQNYEILTFSQSMPMHCSLQRIGQIDPHMHDFFEIVLFLSGTCEVTVENESYTLGANDVIAFNSHTTHALTATDCVLVSVQFDQTLFENTLPEPYRPTFECNSAIQGNLPAFDRVRRLIARLVKNNADARPGYELRDWSLVYELMDALYNDFRLDDSSSQGRRLHRYADRMRHINKIVEERYAQNLSLAELADEVGLSVPYLSRFFKQYYGINYLDYLTQIRLNHAVEALMGTGHTIEQVSAENGFANSHAFVQAFKRQYGMLPSVYRRQMRSEQHQAVRLIPEQHDYIAGLKKYLGDSGTTEEHQPEQAFSCLASCDVQAHGVALAHAWRTIMPGGNARDLLFSDVQDLVRRMQGEIGFGYIYFHGLLSDDMRLCSRTADGSIAMSYAYVDKVLDFVLQQGLKPIVELGFMPEALAKNPRRRFLNDCVSEPQSLSEWGEMITLLAAHLIRRYGADEVTSWLFTPWSTPESSVALFGFSSDEAFYEFYRTTWQALKTVDARLSVGTPNTYYLRGQDNWYLPFVSWCEEHGCPPDFLAFHYYDTVRASESSDAQSLFGFADSMTLSETPDGFADFVREVRRDNHANRCIYLTEWNNTPSQQDWLNDTCFKSCYLTKMVLENMDLLDGYGYWSLTDWMGEAGLPDELFFGGAGLFTKNGIPKPSYYALSLLRQLGDERIGQGEGWYATRKGDTYQVMLYNYRHFSHLYALGERFDMTFTDRYTPFSPERSMDVHLVLRGVAAERYLVREVSVSRDHGSAFDTWVRMGAVELEDPMELENLEARSHPSITRHFATPADGTLELDALIQMLEVRLLLIIPAP